MRAIDISQTEVVSTKDDKTIYLITADTDKDDIEIVKRILNGDKRVQYTIYDLKEVRRLGKDLINNAIFVSGTDYLPCASDIPEGYFIVNPRTEKTREVVVSQTEQHVIFPIYIFFPSCHLYENSPSFIVEYDLFLV